MLEGDEVRPLTFGEAWLETRRYAAALRCLGVGRSTRVALAPRNRMPDVLTMLGALTLGAHVWMINPGDPEERVRRQVKARRPDVLLGEVTGAVQLRLGAGDDGADVVPQPVEGSTPALMFNTSGSTGVPKAVMQAHSAVLANARSFTMHHRLRPGRMVLGFLPMHHVNAVHSNLMSTLYAGSECFLLRPDSLLRLHRWIESSRPYMVSLVPSAADALLTSWRRPTVPDELHHVLSAASPLSASTVRNFRVRIGRRIIQGYGLSETMNFSTTVPINLDDETYARITTEPERPSIGCAIPGVEVMVCDPDGAVVPEGEVGELCVRGQHLMSGYADDPEATRAAFRHGWFRTGDLGYQRFEPGLGAFYYITGRSKNIATVRGEQIGLEEIENALVSLPGVIDAVCATEPDDRDGERIVAGVVVRSGVETARLLGALAALLPAFGLPNRLVTIDLVPRTPTGKILRTESAKKLQVPT